MLVDYKETERNELFQNPNFIAKEADKKLGENQGNIKEYLNQVQIYAEP